MATFRLNRRAVLKGAGTGLAPGARTSASPALPRLLNLADKPVLRVPICNR